MKQRIFSGIQPSGNLHIGNYGGAMKQWVQLQESFDALFCIVDLHAITVAQDPEMLRKRTLEIAKMYLAAGIDPKKSALFVQSHVREHTELAWILNTLTRNGDLTKMTQFKDKSGLDFENIESWGTKENLQQWKKEFNAVGVGLFDYPVLMAADILLYDTAVVPVGDDQVQHVELARTLARRFNARFGETFVVPESKVRREGARIMGLDNPLKKMSKSAASEFNFIALLDEPEKGRKKIMKAVTDSGSEVVYEDEKPALKNLLNIFSLLEDIPVDDIARSFVGKGYADLKRALADSVANFLTRFQHNYFALSDEETLRVMKAGADRARTIASEKMKIVRERMGFLS